MLLRTRSDLASVALIVALRSKIEMHLPLVPSLPYTVFRAMLFLAAKYLDLAPYQSLAAVSVFASCAVHQ